MNEHPLTIEVLSQRELTRLRTLKKHESRRRRQQVAVAMKRVLPEELYLQLASYCRRKETPMEEVIIPLIKKVVCD